MQTLARLFGRSPFALLQTHMKKVAACVEEIVPLFAALEKKDYKLVEETAERISKLEHDADLTKNDIRDNLRPGLFLPIPRASFLEILELQDNLADCSEDIAVLLTIRPLEIQPNFSHELQQFLKKNLETFEGANQIIQEMGELLESSFGGSEAEKVTKMVEEVAFKEHEADIIQLTLLKKLFAEEAEGRLSASNLYLWMKVVQEIASLSDESENLANRIRMTLEVKS